MRVFFSGLVLIFLYIQGISQVSIQLRDANSGETLRNVIISGVDNFKEFPNGIMELNFNSQELPDSIVILKDGFQNLVIYPPYDFNFRVFNLHPLNIKMDEVVIQINQNEKTLKEATGSLLFIRSEDLFMHQDASFSHQLNKLPGVYMQSGTNNTNRLTIRGIGSRTPYSSNRIRAYIDDFPLTDGNGVSVIEDTEPELIESVEIIKGPAAALYGSGLGGILKINTKKFLEKENSISLKSQMGSFGTGSYSFRANYSGQSSGVQILASRHLSEGYRENNEYERNSLVLQAVRQNKNTRFDLLFLYTFLRGEIPSSINLEDFENNPQKAAENWNSVDGYEKYHRLGLSLKAKTIIGSNFSHTSILNLGFKNPYEVRPFNILDDKNYSFSLSENLRYYYSKWMISLKADVFFENYIWKTLEIENKEAGALINHYSDKRVLVNSGIQLSYEINQKLNFNTSLNFNYTAYSLENLAQLMESSENYQFDPVISPAFGLNYEINEHLNLYSSAGHGFSPPSIEETLLPDGEINTELKPEAGIMVETGVRSSFGNFFWMDFTLYAMNIKNMLVTKRITEDQFTGINAGEVSYKGIELQILSKEFELNKNIPLNMSLATTYSRSINTFENFTDDGIKYDGNQLPGIPEQSWNNHLKFRLKNDWIFHLSHSYTGEQFITDDNLLKYQSFHLANFSISGKVYSIDKNPVLIRAGIRNLLNEKYASMLLVNAPSFGNSLARYYYPGNPRNVYIGIIIEIQ